MRPLLVTFVLLSLIPVVIAQPSPQTVSEADARQHLVQHTDPVYPAIARAARIQGSVVVKVVIDPTGKVLSEKVLSGRPCCREPPWKL
jgi:protein TonB